MATLAGNTIASTYALLLKVASSGIGGTPLQIEDGDATGSALYLGTGTAGIGIVPDSTTFHIHTASAGSVSPNAAADELTLENSGATGMTMLAGTSSTCTIAMGDSGSNYMGVIIYDNSSDALKFKAANIQVLYMDVNSKISLSNNDSNTGNTVFGYSAFNTSSDNASDSNVAIGHLAMGTGSVAGATENVAIGYGSFDTCTSGDNNVFIGSSAGGNSTDIIGATAVGRDALNGSTTTGANYTTAIGFGALTALTSGAGNTAVGYQAGAAITTGALNTAVGYQALSQNQNVGNFNTAVGYRCLYSVNPAADDEGFNTAMGTAAGFELTTGEKNTYIGNDCGYYNETGDDNVYVGHNAGVGANNNNHSQNTGVGANALFAATTGGGNTAVGYNALKANLGAGGNVAVGSSALAKNTSGANNTAMGHSALGNNVSEDANTALGQGAMQAQYVGSYDNTFVGFNAGGGTWANNPSVRNTGIGRGCMSAAMDAGNDNTAVGHGALGALTDANDNVGVGANAGDTITTGSANTCVGYNSDVASSGAANQQVFGTGGGGGVTDDNSVSLGNGAITNVYMSDDKGAKVWCTNIDSSSDIRIKKNIEKVTIGLDFVNELNPVTFNMRKSEDWDEDLKKEQSWYKKNTTPRDIDDEENKIGFIAQEVKASLDKYNVDCDIYAMKDNDKVQSLDYSRFVVPLVKAIQELSAKVKALEDAQ